MTNSEACMTNQQQTGRVLMLDPQMLDHRFSVTPTFQLAHYWTEGEVAVVEVRGHIEKYCCGPHAAVVAIEQSVREAGLDEKIKAVIVRIDSPGGSWLGVQGLVETLRRMSAVKPIYAYVSDLALSGGYWIAAGCDKIYAGVGSLVGSIGAYAVLTDTTDLEKKVGIKRLTVSSTPLKGLGADGAVTPEVVDEVQMIVDRLHAAFVADVKAGRKGWDGTRADGTAIPVEDALKIGLVDAVISFDALMAKVQGEVMSKPDEIVVPTPAIAAPASTPAPVGVSKEEFDALVKSVAELTAGIKARDDANAKIKADSLATILASAKANGYNMQAETLEDAVKQLASVAGLTNSHPKVEKTDAEPKTIAEFHKKYGVVDGGVMYLKAQAAK